MVKVKTGSCFDRSITLQLGKDTTVRLTGRGSIPELNLGFGFIRFSLIPLNNNLCFGLYGSTKTVNMNNNSKQHKRAIRIML